MEIDMAKKIRGTNRDDTIEQDGRVGLRIDALGGDDTIVLDRTDDLGGSNSVDAGKGDDTVANAFEGDNRIRLGSGDDTYVGTGFSLLNTFDVVAGGAGADRFFVSTLLSTYIGGKGNDTFFSHGFRNDFIGGAGTDTVSYEFRNQSSVVGNEGVTIDLAAGLAQTGSLSQEVLKSIENAIGSANSDLIGGTDGNNVLVGLSGRDEIHGFDGNDVINGGFGEDFLTGGGGADRFVYQTLGESASGAIDIIGDFSSAEGDKLDFSAFAGADAFVFIGADGFSGRGGEFRFDDGFLFADIGGNGNADVIIDMQAVTALQASDFLF
jgi:Ca2+-binding RTX toxin-like protein